MVMKNGVVGVCIKNVQGQFIVFVEKVNDVVDIIVVGDVFNGGYLVVCISGKGVIEFVSYGVKVVGIVI